MLEGIARKVRSARTHDPAQKGEGRAGNVLSRSRQGLGVVSLHAKRRSSLNN